MRLKEMMIDRNIMEQIFTHAKREAPIEACGYLTGIEGRVTRAHPMTNADGREDHFSFVPEEQFAIYKAAREEGLQVIGVYHSHPVTPARPSLEDIRLAYDPTILYVIVSLMGGKQTIKGFRIRAGEVGEEPLTVESSTGPDTGLARPITTKENPDE